MPPSSATGRRHPGNVGTNALNEGLPTPDVSGVTKQSFKFAEKALRAITTFLKSKEVDQTLKTFIVLGLIDIIVIVLILILCLMFAALNACCDVPSYPRDCIIGIIVLVLALFGLGVPVLLRSGSTEHMLRTKHNFQTIAQSRRMPK